MKIRVDTLQASQTLEHDVYLSIDDPDKLIMPCYDYNDPKLFIEMDKRFTVDSYGGFQSDYEYRSFSKYTDGMNMSFNGKAEVIFGNFRTTDDNMQIFSVTDPKEAAQVLVRVSPNEGTKNKYEQGLRVDLMADSPEVNSALYFHSTSQVRHQYDTNFYVLNVGHVFGKPDRDVSQFLDEMSQRIAQEEKTYDKEREINEAKEQAKEILAMRSREAGCPSNFLYPNNPDDNKFASAIVIKEDGELRFPDEYGDYYERIFDHGSYEEWEQIYEGEAVVAFTRNNDEPLVFHPEWMPPVLTDAQKKTIINYAKEYSDKLNTELVNENGKRIAPEETIISFLNKYEDQEMNKKNAKLKEIESRKNRRDAYEEFMYLEERIEELAANKYEDSYLLTESERKELYDSSIKYMELAEQHGFETKFDFTFDVQYKDISNSQTVRKNDDYDPGSDR